MSHFAMHKEIKLEELGGGVSRRIMAYSDNIMPVEVHFEKGAIGTLHTHPHEQATYVVCGKFEFTCDGEKKVVETGDSIYFSPNVMHGTVCLESGILLDVFTPCRKDFIK